jgi:hypothetical protein
MFAGFKSPFAIGIASMSARSRRGWYSRGSCHIFSPNQSVLGCQSPFRRWGGYAHFSIGIIKSIGATAGPSDQESNTSSGPEKSDQTDRTGKK